MPFLCAAALSLFCACSDGRSGERTPLGKPETAAVLRDAHHAVTGVFPSKARLASAWAQVRLEAAPSCHNLGNIGATGDAPFYRLGGYKWQAFPSFVDGAVGYWQTIVRNCGGALPYFDAGDAMGAAVRLRRCNYHQSDVGAYGRGMASLYREAVFRILPLL